MQLKLAWRNIWRNRRRTLITMAMVFFAVILSALLMSLKEGTYVNMIDSMIGAHIGYVQVQANGFKDQRKLEYTFELTDSLREAVENTRGVESFTPRLESFALAASDKVTRGVAVIGVDPESESNISGLEARISQGDYLSEADNAALLGAGLAEYMQVGVGDTIILLGAGYQGANAAGKYPIKGLVKFGSPELSDQLVFIPIQVAQQLYNAERLHTNLVLSVKPEQRAQNIARSLQMHLDSRFAVLAWQDLLPELKKMIETDRVEGYVFMFILYMVISFGIFGTMLMMLAERRREFGVMIAVGVRRLQLASMVWIEMVLISVLGAIAGIIGAFPVCAWFYYNPIRFGDEMEEMIEEYGMEAVMQASVQPAIFIQQGIVVFVIAGVIAFYPFLKFARLRVMNALHK